jgi:DNA-binding response OmpR family regulator
LNRAPHVLIVDASAESREILRMLLQRQGATTLEAGRADQALQLADACTLDLIVLDADSDFTASGEAAAGLCAAAERNATPIVILGTLDRRSGTPYLGQTVAKPYHYGPLVRKIENLLAAV